MRRGPIRHAVLTLACTLALPMAAAAQQAFSVNLGYFAVRGEDARVEHDVLATNLQSLVFELKDFNNASVGAEYLIGLGEHVEAGLGVGFYRRTVPSVYADLTNFDGTEIEQEMKLRMVPLTAVVRLLPLGRSSGFQPYIGGGVGVYSWRYSEAGEFVDARDSSIFRDRFTASGTEVGPVILGGLRVPMGAQFSLGGELRYQRARGTVGVDNGFTDDKIDLGGYTTQVTFNMRF